jgi:hypothetical protein
MTDDYDARERVVISGLISLALTDAVLNGLGRCSLECIALTDNLFYFILRFMFFSTFYFFVMQIVLTSLF